MYGERDVHSRPMCGMYTVDQHVGRTQQINLYTVDQCVDVHSRLTCGCTDMQDIHSRPTYMADGCAGYVGRGSVE